MAEWIDAADMRVRVRVDGDALVVVTDRSRHQFRVPLDAEVVDALSAQLAEWRGTRGGLNAHALETLAAAGLTVTDWARRNNMSGAWCGDACGCPDSRCIGFHHHGPDDCGCLPALLQDGGR